VVLTFLRPNLRIAVYAACLFCVVLGLKWATFDRFGSAMPDWDQWDAEAYYAIIPWFENDHFLKNIFTPHNEHRVVLTKPSASSPRRPVSPAPPLPLSPLHPLSFSPPSGSSPSPFSVSHSLGKTSSAVFILNNTGCSSRPSPPSSRSPSPDHLPSAGGSAQPPPRSPS